MEKAEAEAITLTKMYPYRVFISYTETDKDKAAKLVRAVKDMGLVPLWDENIQPGEELPARIKTWISHSHLFIQLSTQASRARPWVQPAGRWIDGNSSLGELIMMARAGMARRYSPSSAAKSSGVSTSIAASGRG
jgi:hypothetical protein